MVESMEGCGGCLIPGWVAFWGRLVYRPLKPGCSASSFDIFSSRVYYSVRYAFHSMELQEWLLQLQFSLILRCDFINSAPSPGTASLML
jgi:hypothetical protein